MATRSSLMGRCEILAGYSGAMRILVVSTWYPTRDAPFRTPFITRHVRAIARDHQVHVIHVQLLEDSPVTQENYDGVAVTRVGFDPRKPLTMVRALAEIRRWARFSDVVHTMAFSSALIAAPVVWRRPWVHTEHWNGVLFPDHVNRLWERAAWLRHLLRLPRVVTGVSTLMTRKLEEFARSGATRLIGNVVDHAPQVAQRPDDGALRLIGVGAATEHKGALLAVDTVEWLRDQGHDASLVWDGDGPMREQAERRALELGIADHVDFRGFRGTEDLWRDLAESTIFILPSKSETFCVAAAEALAAGRPVIMGDRGGQGDFLTDRNGRMVSERSPEAFGRAVLDLMRDPATATPDEMAREIRARYGSDAVSDQLTDLYQSVQGGGRRR